MRQVFSSRVDEIGHDPETGELFVKWKNSGKVSVYSGIDAEKAKTVMNSYSIGQTLNDLVIGQHDHAYR